MTDLRDLWLYFMQRLFGKSRSADLQKLGTMFWPILVGIGKLKPESSPGIAWKQQLQFVKDGQVYYVRVRHIDRVNNLPRRIEICKAVGTRSIPILIFTNQKEAEAFMQQPSLK